MKRILAIALLTACTAQGLHNEGIRQNYGPEEQRHTSEGKLLNRDISIGVDFKDVKQATQPSSNLHKKTIEVLKGKPICAATNDIITTDWFNVTDQVQVRLNVYIYEKTVDVIAFKQENVAGKIKPLPNDAVFAENIKKQILA